MVEDKQKRQAFYGMGLCILPVLLSNIINYFSFRDLSTTNNAFDYHYIIYIMQIICVILAIKGPLKKLNLSLGFTKNNFFKALFKYGIAFWIYIILSILISISIWSKNWSYYWNFYIPNLKWNIISIFLAEIILRGLFFNFLMKYYGDDKKNFLPVAIFSYLLFRGLPAITSIIMNIENNLPYYILRSIINESMAYFTSFLFLELALDVIYYKTKNLGATFILNFLFTFLFHILDTDEYFFRGFFYELIPSIFKNAIPMTPSSTIAYLIIPAFYLPLLIVVYY